MKRVLIATIDATRARLFAYEEGAAPALELRELRDLVSIERPHHVRDAVSSTEPGRAGAADGPAQGNGPHGTTTGYERSATDDHRDARMDELDLRFARQVVQQIEELVNQDAYQHLIISAPPKMLGQLRKVDGVLQRADLHIDDLPQELAHLSVAQLHDHLAARDLIPPRRRLAAAR
ncbi:MAG TPA: host attachment protein [Kofleriaceae bacterium]|nr:host attachment protein [Kofleriaceae bacterium]